MKNFLIVVLLIFILFSCQKQEDSEELFMKAEGFVKLNMYKDALDIYIELKSREYKTEIVQERIRFLSSKIAEEKLKSEAKSIVIPNNKLNTKPVETISSTASEFKVKRCDETYNERIKNIKNDMEPYQNELKEIESKLSKITSQYKVVNIDGGYNFAVPADTPKEKQKEIAEGPAKEFGTLTARKNEIMQKINKFNEDINKVFEDARKAGQPSDCIKR